MKKRHLTNYWISYSDLMAGLLFVLMAIVVISNIQYKQRTNDIGENINLRHYIAQELKNRFEKQNIQSAEVDDTTGNIVFLESPEAIWFVKPSPVLQPQGKKTLNEVIPIYLNVLFDEKITGGMLDRIMIEGHASLEEDKPEKYLYNLNLSEKRALSVGTYIIENNPQYYKQLKKHLVTLGRSFADAKHTGTDYESSWKDRKVLIKFTLQYEQMMRELQGIGL